MVGGGRGDFLGPVFLFSYSRRGGGEGVARLREAVVGSDCFVENRIIASQHTDKGIRI